MENCEQKDAPSEGSHMAAEECDNNDSIPKDNFLSQEGHIEDESVHMKEPKSPRNVKVNKQLKIFQYHNAINYDNFSYRNNPYDLNFRMLFMMQNLVMLIQLRLMSLKRMLIMIANRLTA